MGLDDDMVLTLYPQVTSLQSFQNINGALYPIIDTVEEQATVRALKGEVIVLGGLKQESLDSTTRAAVPVPPARPGQAVLLDLQADEQRGGCVLPHPEIVEDPVYPLDMK